MAQHRRRGIDVRRIRTTVSYAVLEIADLVDVHPHTVRRWIKEGLPTVDDTRPTLVHGADLRAFIMEKRAFRRHQCGEDQLFCCRCRQPRRPRQGSVELALRNRRTLLIKGNCERCGCRMNRAGATRDVDTYRQIFGAMTTPS